MSHREKLQSLREDVDQYRSSLEPGSPLDNLGRALSEDLERLARWRVGAARKLQELQAEVDAWVARVRDLAELLEEVRRLSDRLEITGRTFSLDHGELKDWRRRLNARLGSRLAVLGTQARTKSEFERDRRELALQTALFGPLISVKGQASVEFEVAFNRTLELCERVDAPQEKLRALFARSLSHTLRGQHLLSHKTAEELLA